MDVKHRKAGETYKYGIIGNCSSAALISSKGSIDWLCLPIFDSPSLFANILDNEKGGKFEIVGVNTIKTEQKYVPHTAILKTTIQTTEGIFEINDYMPRFMTSIDASYCPSEIHRNIRVISGKPKITVKLMVMPNYALSKARYKVNDDHIKITNEAGDYYSFFLYSNLNLKDVISGKEIRLKPFSFFVLSYHEKLEPVTNDKIYLEYEKTKSYWLNWAQHTRSPKKYRDQVIRSAITLKLLTFQKTGASIAAPTTSLPEIIGESRNWDYRYCWIRDASMAIELYARIGHFSSATRFLNFILNMLPRKTENIRVMYGITGEKNLQEKTLGHLSGYKNSKPVRIGNEAYLQVQNDLCGELIEAIYTYFVLNQEKSMQLTEEIWTVVRSLVKQVENTWKNPDSGIWERRKALEHYVHSKMMNWVAMDRAIKIAKLLDKSVYVDKWSALAGEIKQDILNKGWNDKIKAFSMFYGSDIYDASNLLMLHYGFLDRNDPKIISTVKQYYKHLVKNGFTFRYISDDEFGVPKSAFIVCTFWMINSLYLIGEKEKAAEMFNNITSSANKLGLFSEAIDINSGRLVGNFPQGYSHLSHIQTMFLLETDYDWSDVTKMKGLLV
ncbi:glycoside hydrolase family 15 protein [Candidatus Margulisiibacteriota bacterium]